MMISMGENTKAIVTKPLRHITEEIERHSLVTKAA